MREYFNWKLAACLITCLIATTAGDNGILSSKNLEAQEIGFLEDFALAKDREKVLKQLVPGTEKYYYFHALHYQNTQQLDKVDELMVPWLKRLGETATYQQIRNRQSLLKYSDDPQATLTYLKKQLGLSFAHQRTIPDAQRELPTKLDPDLYSIETLLEKALGNGRSNTQEIRDKGLTLLAGRKLSKTQRRHLLQRLKRPDFPKVVDLIVADLKERDSKSFGSMPIHNSLTTKQLDELGSKYSKVKSQNNYVNIYLSKLLPSEDTDWRSDPVENRKYLERLWEYVETLNPNFNSLKANVLYRRLELDLREDKHDRELLMTYLALPRNIGYINPVLIKNVESRSHIVNMNADYSARCYIVPIINDQQLVRDYLHHFLLDSQDYKDFEPFIREPYLKRQFAVVKILNGIGDVEQWASMLTPEEYKRVIDRVDVEFLSTNPEFFAVDDDVQLELYLKNVENLIVKVFEVNTSNYYRKYKKEIDTDINLDGLVPNFEETFKYDQEPALRTKRQFKFPQIKGRGVYVVDFIAGGKSSRALIRKGRLQMFSRVTPVGQLFTVIDQSGASVMDADLWIGGSRYNATDSGKILVPFSTRPGRVPAIISQGKFSCLQTFDHVAEKYQFKAALVLDRENLTRSNTARVLIRPSLQIVGGNPVPVSMLKDARLNVVSTNLDGVNTTKVIQGLEFSEKEETVCEFIVPPRLKDLRMSLVAKYKNRSYNRLDTASASQSYAINSIDQSEVIQDIHLLPTDRGYFLEVLGKTGEVRPKQAVILNIRPSLFQRNVTVELQSDAKGLIALGELKNVRNIKADVAGGGSKTFAIHNQDQTYYRTVHAQLGESIEIPAPAGVVELSRDTVSLFEIRNNTFVADKFDSVSVDKGLITISDLSPGDYDLRLTYQEVANETTSRDIKIRVTDGPQTDNVYVGKHRHLESRGSKTLHVYRVSTSKTRVRIQLENADQYTRVHVIGNRYQPAFNSYNMFANITDLEPWVRKPSLRRSVYMEGRKIGDEYAYILRRKYAQKYPGNMLERPSLLLNPWEVQATSNSSLDAAKGNDYQKAGNAADKKSNRSGANIAGRGGSSDVSNLDYLGDGAVLLANLKPSKSGIVSIDRRKLGPNQHIRIIALNAFHTVERTVNLPLKKLKPRDSRLANALDPSKHFSQSKQIEILKKGDTLTIDDIVSAKFQQYDDLEDVFQLFSTLNPGAQLSRFKFILDWEDKPVKEKQKLYSEFACHELNYFLLQKDPEFFDAVVAPHLKHKRDKTFLDLWLLDEDVAQFISPWKFARLNAFEKILLSQRLETQSADIIRNTNEAYLVAPTSRAQYDALFDTTILGLGLDGNRDWSRRSGQQQQGMSGLPGLARAPSFSSPQNERGLVGGGVVNGGVVTGGFDPDTDVDGIVDSGSEIGGSIVSNDPNSNRWKSPLPAADAASPKSAEAYGYDGDELLFAQNEARKQARSLGEFGDVEVEMYNGQAASGERDYFYAENSNKKSRDRNSSLGRSHDGRKRLGLDRFYKSRSVPVTRMRTEAKTRQVPVQRTRTETRSRTLSDGTVENYTVQVPYTEQVTQNYTVQVPVTSSVQQSYFDEAEFEKLEDEIKQMYRRLGPTKQWMENNYYLLRPEQQTPQLVTVNRFWRDYSNHEGGDFLSPYFSESHRTFTEMMFALSVLDLPLKSPEQKFEYADNTMKMTATGPMIVLHQQVRDAVFERGNTTVLVSENFYQKNDRFKYEDGVRFDKFISDEFLAHTLYGAQVVITNPTSTPQAVELLVQIPLGSVASGVGSQETRTYQMDLAAFSTKKIEYAFYFPTAGEFGHYPAHVSAEEKVLAVAAEQSFKVVDRPAEVNEQSWAFVSQNGSQGQVLEFLNKENILRLNLNQIAFRMRDKGFFNQVIKTLRNRYVYNQTLWSYSVMHNDLESLKEYLTHVPKIVSQCGRYFESEPLSIDPVERNWYQHKEYWPLVNDRAHQLGPQRKILNPSFYSQYRDLLSVLSNRRELSEDDHLVVTYYMLLQDRVETALDHFESVAKGNIPSEMQYDYCDAYLDMYRENPSDAQAKAALWADYPVEHWRKRFEQILAQVDEIKGGETKTVDENNNAQRQTQLASNAESFEVEIDAGKAKLNYQNLTEFVVNYYEMDIELLFSRSPFAQDNLDGFSLIRPNVTQEVKVKKGKGKGKTATKGVHEFELSSKMKNRNVLIEVVAGDQAKSQPYFAHSLDVQTIQKFGQIHVTGEETGKPIPKSYVKVYARKYDGSVRFHKDGYTDLRGRFDYLSQSNRSIDGIEKFSILVLSEKNGAVIRQAELPQE